MVSRLKLAVRLALIITAYVSICILQTGCRKTLSSAGPSRLWPKYIQRQSDIAWKDQGFCETHGHLACQTSDYQAGFSKGFYNTAYHRIQPDGPCTYQPPPFPSRIGKRTQNLTSPAMVQGYQNGSHVASSSTIAGIHPGDAPLPGVSRVYSKQ
jgi:hypothetical protein